RVAEEIDHGNATGTECSGGNAAFQRLAAFGPLEGRDQEDDLRAVAESFGSQAIQSREVEEKELLRKAEVFHDQPVTGEAAPRVRQHALFFRKAHRAQR